VRRRDRERIEIVEREIPIARGVQAVRRGTRKTKFLRNGIAIDRERAAGQRPRTHRASVGGCARGFHAFHVAKKSLRVRE
jgi:hypothetical protein